MSIHEKFYMHMIQYILIWRCVLYEWNDNRWFRLRRWLRLNCSVVYFINYYRSFIRWIWLLNDTRGNCQTSYSVNDLDLQLLVNCLRQRTDRKSTRLNSSHVASSS